MKHAPAYAALVLLAACSKTPLQGAGHHAWSVRGTMRIAIASEPKSLNPLLSTDTTDAFVDRLLFEPLLAADPHGNPVAMLAARVPSTSNGGISKDGLTIVYRLRPDARWSDGTPVTSRDVEWSWRAIMNPRNDVIVRHGYDLVRSLQTPDAQTVVVRLARPFAPFVNTFFAESDSPYAILPAHAFAAGETINRAALNTAPTVSDGPFRFVSWSHGDKIVLTANPHFFKGRPGLDRVVVEIVPDENSAVNLLRTHAIDYLYQPSVATYPALRDLPDAAIVWSDVNGYEALEFNLSRPAVSDPRIRLAIAQAIDKSAFVRELTHGREPVATEDLPHWMWAFDPTVRSYPYDVAGAKRLMERAGYRYGSDGAARKDGRALQLLLATDSGNATHRAESVLLQAALRRIGIGVEVKSYPMTQLYETAALGGIVQSGRFDLTTAPWYGGIDPDDSSEFTCAMRPPNGYNTSRYCDAEMDRWQRAALTHYDRGARTVAYAHVQRLLAHDNPYVFLWWLRGQEALSTDVQGFSPNPVTQSWNAWQWRIR